VGTGSVYPIVLRQITSGTKKNVLNIFYVSGFSFEIPWNFFFVFLALHSFFDED